MTRINPHPDPKNAPKPTPDPIAEGIGAGLTCAVCDRLGWPSKGPLYGVEGRSLCWAHATAHGSEPGSAMFWAVNAPKL